MIKPGFYSRISNFGEERVEVLCVATHRTGREENRKQFVVFRHDSSDAAWTMTEEEWREHAWQTISRSDFNDGKAFFGPCFSWAITTEVKDGKPRYSDGVLVQKVVSVLEPEQPKADEASLVRVKVGSHGYAKRRVLDGKVYRYREDARRAKTAYCKANGVQFVGSAAHFGYDGE